MLSITPLQEKYRDGFIVSGHAEYAEHGADIVCSAVSAITQTTEMALKRQPGVISMVEPGHMEVTVVRPNVYTNVLIDAMLNGLRSIEVKYPKYVTIQEEYHDKRF